MNNEKNAMNEMTIDATDIVLKSEYIKEYEDKMEYVENVFRSYLLYMQDELQHDSIEFIGYYSFILKGDNLEEESFYLDLFKD